MLLAALPPLLLLAQLSAALSDVCEFTLSGLHVIPNPSNDISFISGIAACREWGWKYADVTTADWEIASWVVGNCTTDSVGINTYNGYVDSNCQFMQASGVFGVGVRGVNCRIASTVPLLCAENSPIWKRPADANVDAAVDIALVHPQTAKKLEQDFTLCPYSHSNLHLLTGPYMHSEAEGACQSHDLTLAQVNTPELLAAVSSLWAACDPIDATAWMGVESVVAGGRCQFVYAQGPGMMWIMVSEGEHPCTLPSANVLCMPKV